MGESADYWAGRWQAVATILYAELSRWGFGDFHYGETPRDPEVLSALAVYDEALRNAQRDRAGGDDA